MRPNLMMVSCRHVLPSPVGVHVMKFFFRVASAMTCVAIMSADRLVAAPAEVGEAAGLIGREDRRRLHVVRRLQRLYAEQVVDHAVVLRVGQARDLRRDGDAARGAEADAAAGRAGDHRAGAGVARRRRSRRVAGAAGHRVARPALSPVPEARNRPSPLGTLPIVPVQPPSRVAAAKKTIVQLFSFMALTSTGWCVSSRGSRVVTTGLAVSAVARQPRSGRVCRPCAKK